MRVGVQTLPESDLFHDHGSNKMIPKKSADKQMARSRLSLASRFLGSALRSTLSAPLLEEPWRNNKSKGNQSGKKRK
jgi:hypothetical protein